MPDELIRFSCRNPDCWVKHEFTGSDDPPTLCPECGSRIIIDSQLDPLTVSKEMLADITDMTRTLNGPGVSRDMAAMLVIMAPILERNTAAMTRLAEAIERMDARADRG